MLAQPGFAGGWVTRRLLSIVALAIVGLSPVWVVPIARAADQDTLKIGIIGAGNIGGNLAKLWAKAGHELDEALFARMRDAHIRYLAEEIEHPGDGVKDVMPGIRELLPVLQSRDDVFLGLLTGNFEEAARIKLGHFDLWDYFRCGAFGDDAADRNKLVPFAVDRARTCGFGSFDYADVLVIGDTPHDVACAVAVGAQPVAVATGGFSVEQLRATGAPIVLEDLSDTASFLALLESGAREPQRQEG